MAEGSRASLRALRGELRPSLAGTGSPTPSPEQPMPLDRLEAIVSGRWPVRHFRPGPPPIRRPTFLGPKRPAFDPPFPGRFGSPRLLRGSVPGVRSGRLYVGRSVSHPFGRGRRSRSRGGRSTRSSKRRRGSHTMVGTHPGPLTSSEHPESSRRRTQLISTNSPVRGDVRPSAERRYPPTSAGVRLRHRAGSSRSATASWSSRRSPGRGPEDGADRCRCGRSSRPDRGPDPGRARLPVTGRKRLSFGSSGPTMRGSGRWSISSSGSFRLS